METEAVPLSFDIFTNDDVEPTANPIILMHGLLWNKFMLKELGYKLCKETKRTVFSLDLRNHGESPFSKRCDIELMAEDVKRFIRDQGLKKVVFISHSFSSTIAYLAALAEPQSVEKIVMIDHPPFADFTKTFISENVLPQFVSQNRVLKKFDSNISLVEAKRRLLQFAASGTKAQEYFFRKLAYDLDKVDNEFKWKIDLQFLQDQYLAGAFTVKPKGSLTQEILIIRCKDSGVISDSKFRDVILHNPNARLETIEDTTHLLMFEKEEIFLQFVKEFLK